MLWWFFSPFFISFVKIYYSWCGKIEEMWKVLRYVISNYIIKSFQKNFHLCTSVLKFIHSEKATKFCEIFPLLLTVCTVVRSKGKISQNFMAFSEYMNFNSKEKSTKIWTQTITGTLAKRWLWNKKLKFVYFLFMKVLSQSFSSNWKSILNCWQLFSKCIH